MDKKIKEYLSKIGSKGGKKSRRKLTPEEARRMNDIKRQKQKKDATGAKIEPKKDN